MSNLIHPFNEKNKNNSIKISVFLILISTFTILGVSLGFLLSKINSQKSKIITNTSTKKTAGIVDKKTFKDKAEGLLKEGGINGEGNFHLERPGGPSQNVYLTSSTVDLSQFVGKKIRIWGQTFAGEKAGWLMDVGFVEILK